MAREAHDTGPTLDLAAMMAVPAAVTQELFAFGARRLKANAEHVGEVMATRTPKDYIDCQMKFAAETMADYADEATRLQAAARQAMDKPD